MREPELLKLLEGLLRASAQPEIKQVEPFDNGTTHGVKARFENGSVCYLAVDTATRAGGR